MNAEGKITDSDVKYHLTFHDVMSNGLSFDRDSLNIMINETSLTEPTDYLKETPDTGDTFTVDLDLVALVNRGVISKSDLEGAVSVYVSYTATVTSDAQGMEAISNTAWVNDSNHDTITGTPGTGGTGTLMFTMGGAVLLAAAGVLLAVNRRKNWN